MYLRSEIPQGYSICFHTKLYNLQTLAVHWLAVDVAADSLSTKQANIITTLHITEILTYETYSSKMTRCLIQGSI
jgi:hypothetical protein